MTSYPFRFDVTNGAETEAYFASKDKSFYKKAIEKLEERITFEGVYVDE